MLVKQNIYFLFIFIVVVRNSGKSRVFNSLKVEYDITFS